MEADESGVDGEIELRVSFCTFTISSIQDDSMMALKGGVRWSGRVICGESHYSYVTSNYVDMPKLRHCKISFIVRYGVHGKD